MPNGQPRSPRSPMSPEGKTKQNYERARVRRLEAPPKDADGEFDLDEAFDLDRFPFVRIAEGHSLSQAEKLSTDEIVQVIMGQVLRVGRVTDDNHEPMAKIQGIMLQFPWQYGECYTLAMRTVIFRTARTILLDLYTTGFDSLYRELNRSIQSCPGFAEYQKYDANRLIGRVEQYEDPFCPERQWPFNALIKKSSAGPRMMKWYMRMAYAASYPDVCFTSAVPQFVFYEGFRLLTQQTLTMAEAGIFELTAIVTMIKRVLHAVDPLKHSLEPKDQMVIDAYLEVIEGFRNERRLLGANTLAEIPDDGLRPQPYVPGHYTPFPFPDMFGGTPVAVELTNQEQQESVPETSAVETENSSDPGLQDLFRSPVAAASASEQEREHVPQPGANYGRESAPTSNVQYQNTGELGAAPLNVLNPAAETFEPLGALEALGMDPETYLALVLSLHKAEEEDAAEEENTKHEADDTESADAPRPTIIVPGEHGPSASTFGEPGVTYYVTEAIPLQQSGEHVASGSSRGDQMATSTEERTGGSAEELRANPRHSRGLIWASALYEPGFASFDRVEQSQVPVEDDGQKEFLWEYLLAQEKITPVDQKEIESRKERRLAPIGSEVKAAREAGIPFVPIYRGTPPVSPAPQRQPIQPVTESPAQAHSSVATRRSSSSFVTAPAFVGHTQAYGRALDHLASGDEIVDHLGSAQILRELPERRRVGLDDVGYLWEQPDEYFDDPLNRPADRSLY